jgi:hypothetical protein
VNLSFTQIHYVAMFPSRPFLVRSLSFALFNLQGTSSMQAPYRSLRRERQSSFTSLHLLFLADFVRSEKELTSAASLLNIPPGGAFVNLFFLIFQDFFLPHDMGIIG